MTDIDLQPTLTGDMISLRPLASDDFPALCEAASDPGIWELHPDSLRHKREIFYERFFMGAMACGGALIVEEDETGRIVGPTRYYDWDPDKREIAIGYTFLERRH
ncbi:MAG: GNAT family N-acetyltransferase [Gammaproteobacteria bacterium]